MAPTTSYDITVGAGRSLDSVLWDALFPKSRVLEVVGLGPAIKEPYFSWQNLLGPAMYVTEANSASTTVDGSDIGTELVVTDASKLPVNSLLLNVSRRTPIGTYNRDEVLLVAAKNGNTLTVVRDAGKFNNGTGSTAHQLGDTYLVLYPAVNEGSKLADDLNQYVKRQELTNHTTIIRGKIEVTGTQLARAMEIVANEFERQFQQMLVHLKNQLVNMVVYGIQTSATGRDSDDIFVTKGLKNFLVDNIVSTNALVDYTTTSLTADAINDLFEKLRYNGADPSQNYVILTSPKAKRVISAFDYALITSSYSEEQVGREVTRFKGDLGFVAEVIEDPLIRPNDLFIINADKVKLVPFRNWQEASVGWEQTGDDLYARTVLGEFTVQVVDPGYDHAALINLDIT